MANRCYICGITTSTDIIINEKRYGIYGDEDLKVCKPCFDLWTIMDYESLDTKVLEKLKVKREENNEKQ